MISWNSLVSDLLNSKKKPQYITKLSQAGIEKLSELIWVFPREIRKLPNFEDFGKIKLDQYFRGKGRIISINARSSSFKKGRFSLQTINSVIEDIHSKINISIVWFNAYPSLVKQIKNAKYISFIGKAESRGFGFQFINPQFKTYNDLEKITNEPNPKDCLEIIYPTINSIPSSKIEQLIKKIPTNLWNEIQEIIPESMLEKRQLIKLSDAFKVKHALEMSKSVTQANNRIIYHEFFIEQLMVKLRRLKEKHKDAIKLNVIKSQYNNFIKLFPYKLTKDQIKACDQIKNDLTSGTPMMRLIQGDVGSGKTSVAMIATFISVKNNTQVALMAPTESLARQHFKTFAEMFNKIKIQCELLLGSDSPKKKEQTYENLKKGTIKIIIGTQSLIQEKVVFNNLSLAIIDEQHKFGVNQRISLIQKGDATHSLIMSATPIPRSLSLTMYGDLDVSIIKEKPAHQKPIKTRIVLPHTFEKFLSFLKTRIEMNEQAFLVVPAIEENPEFNLHNLEVVEKKFVKIFPQFKIGVLHGKLKPEEKDSILNHFSSGEIEILLSTSVVEVGIDIPNATIMAILNPERFGLSSLHQLRGRVGRGSKTGFCFLVLDEENKNFSQKLEILEKTTDGFLIAEEDLKNRGEGNLFGTLQSGISDGKKIANILKHHEILDQVIEDISILSEKNDKDLNQMIDNLKDKEFIFTTT